VTVGVKRLPWVVVGFGLWVVLFLLGVHALLTRGPNLPAPPPPVPAPRGHLYAKDGTPLAVTLKEGRYYPLGESASQLLGFTERGSGRGLEGLERDLNASLSEGRAFTLTLDPWVQAMAEKALWEGLRRSRGAFATLIVLDREGQILAVANGPAFHPLAPRKDPDQDVSWRNHAFLVALEPGSTMKALTWSRAAYANHTFGQGFLVTPLHLAAAFSTLVDGLYRAPRLLLGQEARPTRVFSEATAKAVREALTLSLAPRGFVPGDRPLYTVVLAVHHPKGEIHGSQVAAPIFREVAAGLLAYAGIPPYAEER
jgi:cell division protein FtsI (penicillin-binding protein 3)